MWTNFFDKIYLINLASRPDRYIQAHDELKKYDIPFELVRGVKDVDGRNGIYLTLMGILKEAVEKKYQNILIFEDDNNFVCDPNEVMDKVILQLPAEYDMLFLGANLPSPHLVTRYDENLLKTKRALGLHAVGYSYNCMVKILSLEKLLPIDLTLANTLQHEGNCYCVYPLVSVQREGFSDIEQRHTNYWYFIQDRYQKVIDHLNKHQTA